MTTFLPPPAPPELAAKVREAFGVDLLDLAHVRLAELLDGTGGGNTLDALLQRLFDPRERDLLTVSAFSSAL